MRDVRALCLGALCAGLALPALAQQWPQGGFHEPLAGEPGVGAARSPQPAVGLRPSGSGWTGGVLLNTAQGQGFNPARAGTNDLGLRLRRDFGRVPSEPPQLGADPVEAGAYVGYRFGGKLLLSSAVRQGVAPGLGGTKVDFGASYGFNVTPRHLITLSGSLTLGQASGSAPYYGALTADAVAARDWLGEPGAGFRVSWLYSFGRNFYLNTTLGYERTYGDPERLPGLERNTTSFGTVFGYRW
jgi:hypothetical protein